MSRQPSVLVADDDRELRGLLSQLLRWEDYRVEVVGDGVAALERIARLQPDVAVLDVMMPRMDGLTVAEHVREADPTPGIVFVTALTQPGTRQVARRLGAAAFITKPFDPRELIDSVREVLAEPAQAPAATTGR